jgi:hypothetical protein
MFLIAILTVAALQKKSSSNYINSLTRTNINGEIISVNNRAEYIPKKE